MTEANEPETTLPVTTEAPLAERIERARVRSAEIAADASARAREFVHDHPVASVAGGIVLGALVAGALSRLRRKSVPAVLVETAETGLEEATARLSKLAHLGAELALAYATRAAGASKDGVEKLEEKLGQLSETASEKSAEAQRKFVGLADVVIGALRSRLGKHLD
jgi:hypothetical protein